MDMFPSLHTGPTRQTQVPFEGAWAHFFVLMGHCPEIQPGGLPAPGWMVTVNPNGFDDPEAEEYDLPQCFNGDPDARLAKITGVSLTQLQEAVLAQAQRDAQDHVECDNGGLYAVWELPDGLVLGGFDNGGSDIAQGGVDEVIKHLGAQVLLTGGDSHFQVETLRHNQEHGQLYGDEPVALKIAEELLGWAERQEINDHTPTSAGMAPGPRF